MDISTAHNSLANGESKSATVMAGAAIEALLLWALQEHTTRAERDQAAQALMGVGTLTKKPGTNLQQWVLDQFIEVGAYLAIIDADTAIQARLARNYRNLIHPGRAIRLGQTCDRGTALSAAAAVELVSRDLAQRYT